jgi:hypothetical protein
MARGRRPMAPPKRRPTRHATATVDVTLRMPHELFDTARARAVDEGVPLGELLLKLIAAALAGR